MKRLFFILLFSFLKGFSQNSDDTNVLKIVIEFEKDSNFVYSKKSVGYESLIKIISKKNIYNEINPSNTLILSDNEIKYLKNEIKKSAEYLFQPNLLANSKIISPDTLSFYSANRNKIWRKEMTEVIQSKDSLLIAKFREEKGYPCLYSWVHFFSKPIYFRNNTFCIFYYAKLCDFDHGVGGCSQIIICRKNKNVWEKYNEIILGCY